MLQLFEIKMLIYKLVPFITKLFLGNIAFKISRKQLIQLCEKTVRILT
jgi:hypothetical protein